MPKARPSLQWRGPRLFCSLEAGLALLRQSLFAHLAQRHLGRKRFRVDADFTETRFARLLAPLEGLRNLGGLVYRVSMQAIGTRQPDKGRICKPRTGNATRLAAFLKQTDRARHAVMYGVGNPLGAL